MLNDVKISAVISAYNEENSVAAVVKTTLDSEIIDEVIVVNDGSTDKTANNLEQFISNPKYTYIEYEKNRGKSFAMVEGIEKATGDIIVFIDADIFNFEEKHIKQLITPLVNQEAEMVIGHPTENKFDEKLNPFQMLAGERAVFRIDILPILEDIRHTQYGIETMLNLYYKSKGKKIKFEYLWGVYHLTKIRKNGVNGSFKNYAVEIKQIFKTLATNYVLVMMAVKAIFKGY
ncbi:MAG: glycosyltransferase family 2 protein [Ignavibacteriales bacterium]|nr:glycosyltransferase family 2 protein [Ignavibacteriales bacterium]